MIVDYLIDDGGSTHSYYTKGHVDKAEFIKAIADEYDDDEITAGDILYQYMRKVPTPWHPIWKYQLIESNKGRGAFECTIALR